MTGDSGWPRCEEFDHIRLVEWHSQAAGACVAFCAAFRRRFVCGQAWLVMKNGAIDLQFNKPLPAPAGPARPASKPDPGSASKPRKSSGGPGPGSSDSGTHLHEIAVAGDIDELVQDATVPVLIRQR